MSKQYNPEFAKPYQEEFDNYRMAYGSSGKRLTKYVYRTTALVLQGTVPGGNLANTGREEVCVSHLRRWPYSRGYPLGLDILDTYGIKATFLW